MQFLNNFIIDKEDLKDWSYPYILLIRCSSFCMKRFGQSLSDFAGFIFDGQDRRLLVCVHWEELQALPRKFPEFRHMMHGNKLDPRLEKAIFDIFAYDYTMQKDVLQHKDGIEVREALDSFYASLPKEEKETLISSMECDDITEDYCR